MTNTFEAQVAADLVGKINRKEGLSWEEANAFRTRVTSNLAEIEKYLADQSAIIDARMKTPGADQGTNSFKDSLAEIVKFKDAVTANANYLDQITAQHAHEKEAIVKMVKEKIGTLRKEVAATTAAPASVTTLPAHAAATAATPAPAPANAALEKKEAAPAITAFVGRITDGTLNPVNRVKTNIATIGELLTKGDVSKLPKGVDLATVTTRDLQKALKVEVDGQLGPDTINALLKQMGVSEKYVPKVNKVKKGDAEKAAGSAADKAEKPAGSAADKAEKPAGSAAVKAEKPAGSAAVKAEKPTGWAAVKAEDEEIFDYTYSA